ncbi:MAG: ubiquinone biosynthesis protein Coq4 [Halioglobus sp.]|jgi:ubiquinone biosynthesis protein Coq4
MSRKDRLQAATTRTDAKSLAAAVVDAKKGNSEGKITLAGAMAWAAFSCPDACGAVCDNIASAWLGKGPTPEIPLDLPEAPLEDSFWEAFWKVVDGHDEGYDAISITVAVASLGQALHEDFGDIADNHARNHWGAKNAVSNPIPDYTDMNALADCPKGSLGQSLHEMIVENGYDPEVLERDSIGLSQLPHSLHYLNARILQMHDVWHLVAGYKTTSSNEIAISSFQLAQFGHNYSSMFIAAVMAISTLKEPRGFMILMQLHAEAWQHGQNTPAMMDIEWEKEWNNSLEDIRVAHNIPTYESVFPVDMLETLESASILKKAKVGIQLARFNMRLQKGNRQAATM